MILIRIGGPALWRTLEFGLCAVLLWWVQYVPFSRIACLTTRLKLKTRAAVTIAALGCSKATVGHLISSIGALHVLCFVPLMIQNGAEKETGRAGGNSLRLRLD